MIHILKFVCETLLICFACVELSGPDHSPFVGACPKPMTVDTPVRFIHFLGVDRDWRECKDRQLWVEIGFEDL
jgi:hypothetical protein